MGRLITAGRAAFRAASDALGFDGPDGVVEFETGPVRPRLDMQAALESGRVRYSQFVFSRTDGGGGSTATQNIRPHVLADWTEIASRQTTFVGVAGTEVPPDHDAWVIEAGIEISSGANFTDASIWRRLATTPAGNADIILLHGDTRLVTAQMVRNATFDSPILLPLPWWIPPVSEQTGVNTLACSIRTTAAMTTNVCLSVLSAPRGVFRRLY